MGQDGGKMSSGDAVDRCLGHQSHPGDTPQEGFFLQAQPSLENTQINVRCSVHVNGSVCPQAGTGSLATYQKGMTALVSTSFGQPSP